MPIGVVDGPESLHRNPEHVMSVMSRIPGALAVALLAAAMAAGPAAGQETSVGLEAGLAFADLSADGAGVALGTRTGGRVGAVLSRGVYGPLGVRTGVAWSRKGATVDPSGSGAAARREIELTYLEVPLLLTLRLPEGPAPVTPRLFAGPQVGLETGCSVSREAGAAGGTVECAAADLPFPLDARGTDLGLVVGGGLDFGLDGPVTMTLDARYERGLVDVNGLDDGPAIENRAFTVSVGLLLRLP